MRHGLEKFDCVRFIIIYSFANALQYVSTTGDQLKEKGGTLEVKE